jgi:putative flippase GtrA
LAGVRWVLLPTPDLADEVAGSSVVSIECSVCNTFILLRTWCHDGTLISSSPEYGCYPVACSTVKGCTSVLGFFLEQLRLAQPWVMSNLMSNLAGVGTGACMQACAGCLGGGGGEVEGI